MHAANRPLLRSLLFVVFLAVGLLALWFVGRSQVTAIDATAPAGSSGRDGRSSTAATAAGEASGASPGLPGVGVAAVADPAPAGESAAQRAERRRMAEERLATYRKFAQYPPGSRPARENADQLYPQAKVVRGLPLSLGGRPSEHILLKLRQDRLVVVGTQSIELGIRCEDSQAQLLPCAVESATISALPLSTGQPPGQRPVEFVGEAGSAPSGELVATLRPHELGLVDKSWPLRVEVRLKAGSDPSERGSALFDFLFTPDPPAVSTGPVREELVQGSLGLTYALDVKRPGRYVLHTRVDDVDGKPVAFLEFNDVLPVGPQQVQLRVFGKLILDEKPRFPLKVRDFDGFLLKEDADPDREQIPSRTGYHHTTQVYSLGAFSPAEWQSEEKSRHEHEFEKDVAEAR